MPDSVEIIFDHFPKLSELQREQFTQLQSLYADWNSKINVISRKDIDSLYEKHVLHSLAIHKFLLFQPGSHILDIGTGGGFPGIPLAIVQPQVRFMLVDSIGKKIKVVNEIADALQLQNIKTLHGRAEDINGKFDFVVSRAVAPLPDLVRWCYRKISINHINAMPNGMICLKGGDLREELRAMRKGVQVFDLSKDFEGEFFEMKKLVYVPMD
ncbi:MAG: 16S rRNA (guanine(527)-N(7))-methyltransferase RsmG [Flavobacteriales bacterium]|nr:16S rRNA (guanine(527)-N(7))-methyltransferase RsmG [Flavobacteriales bacterium]